MSKNKECRFMISGAAGSGKTTLINELIADTWQEVETNKLVIRDLIKYRGFRPPSMVSGSNNTYIKKDVIGLSDNPQVFLRELIDWQMVLCNLHTVNMSAAVPSEGLMILDRSAFDSLTYFLFDLVKWGNALANTLSTGELEDSAEASEYSLQTLQTMRENVIIERVQHLATTSIEYVRHKVDKGTESTSAYWNAVIENVYEVLTGNWIRDFSSPDLFGEAVDFPQWNSYEHFKEDACRRIAYIMTQYIELMMTTPGIQVFLRHNPHTGLAEEDGIRITDTQVNLTLESIGKAVIDLMVQYLGETEYMDVAIGEMDYMGVGRLESPAKVWFLVEPIDPEIRYPDVESDVRRRINTIYQTHQEYVDEIP